MRYAGEDCTEAFEALFHSEKARAILATLIVGQLLPGTAAAVAEPVSGAILEEAYPLTLLTISVVNQDTKLFRFRLPSDRHSLHMRPGQHFVLWSGLFFFFFQ